MITPPLTAAETSGLVNLDLSSGAEPLRAMLLSLVAQGVLQVERRQHKGLAGSTTRDHVVLVSAPRDPPEHVAAVLALVRADDSSMDALMRRARAAFGMDLSGYKEKFVVPALIARGLAEVERWRMLGLIPMSAIRRTAAGERERERLSQAMEEARGLPKLLKSQPAVAAAQIVALGAAIYLVSGLHSHFGEIAGVMREPGYDGGVNSGGLDFGGLDAAGIAAIGQSVAAFDSGFGGGDGGGGGSMGGGASGSD